jgi:hypothetical protein
MSYTKEFTNSKGVIYEMRVTTIGGDLAGQEFYIKETGEHVGTTEMYDEMMS